ncbi:MAG: hypothetical protein ACOCMW_06040, partial [Campylobacter hyointestinalis]
VKIEENEEERYYEASSPSFSHVENILKYDFAIYAEQQMKIYLKDNYTENQNVKYQNIIYIRNNIANFIYNKMANDFILNNNKESIEYRLKNIYENFDLSKIDEFCSYTECELEKLTKFHLNHKDKIDESIEILKREFIKFKFMNKNINNPLEYKFKMLIETLESINEIQYHFKIYNDKNYFLTNIIANLLLIETINIKIQDIICQNYE